MNKIIIINKVGKAVAHDEYVPFRVTKGKILVNDEESEMVGKKIKVEFIKVRKSTNKFDFFLSRIQLINAQIELNPFKIRATRTIPK